MICKYWVDQMFVWQLWENTNEHHSQPSILSQSVGYISILLMISFAEKKLSNLFLYVVWGSFLISLIYM